MSGRVRVTIKGSHDDTLTVQDAMQQVLDFFRLLSLSGEDELAVEWRLVYASANSPLVVEAEAAGAAPDVDVEAVARAQKIALAVQLNEVLSGHRPAWDKPEQSSLAVQLMKRTLNGIAVTEIDFEEESVSPLTWTPETARVGIETLEHKPAFEYVFRQHAERGTLEGSLVSGDPYWRKPAIWIRDRHGNNVPCRISDDLHDKITKSLNFEDVWQHRRVAVHGRIYFTDRGRAQRVEADDVVILGPGRDVSLDELFDPSFTDGLSPAEYLDRLREGDLG